MANLITHSRTHLAQASETYWQHMRFAGTVGAMLVAAGLACCLHAFIPGVCRDTASRTIESLHHLIRDRSALPKTVAANGEAIAFAFLFSLSAGAAASFWIAGAGALLALPISLLALAMPVAMLATNPDLRSGEPNSEAEAA